MKEKLVSILVGVLFSINLLLLLAASLFKFLNFEFCFVLAFKLWDISCNLIGNCVFLLGNHIQQEDFFILDLLDVLEHHLLGIHNPQQLIMYGHLPFLVLGNQPQNQEAAEHVEYVFEPLDEVSQELRSRF